LNQDPGTGPIFGWYLAENQAAIVLATFAYQAAMRDGKIPRAPRVTP
jgi:hypothetical protein